MKAIILCAGKGERLRPLTENIPKPMVLIDNRPVLEYLILLFKKHGIEEIGINTSYLPEKIKEYFGDGSKFGVRIKYSFEKELLGTSGALNNFKDFIGDENFFVIYGDNVTDLNLSKMMKYHKEKNAFASLYLYKENVVDEKTTPGATIINESGKIINIIENPNENEKEYLMKIPEERRLINAGVYILKSEVLDLIPSGFSDFSKDIFPKCLRLNKDLYGFQSNCYFKEIGQLSRFNIAKNDIESGNVRLFQND